MRLDLQWVVDSKVGLSKSTLSRSGTQGRHGAVEKIWGASEVGAVSLSEEGGCGDDRLGY